MFVYEVLEDVATIGDKGKRLRVVAWGNREPKLDLRPWREEGETEKPGKGICFSEDEARELAEALQKYLAS